jgi:hypothetical protein
VSVARALGRRPADRTRAGALGLALALAACGGADAPAPPPVPCPSALILEGAQVTSAYDGAGRRPADLRYLAALSDLASDCRYDEAGNGKVDLSFDLIAQKGPSYDGGAVRLQYFVATVAPDQRILAKELFDSDLTFPAGADTTGSAQSLTMSLPGVGVGGGRGYTIYVGFQLDAAEVRRETHPERLLLQ